MIEESAAARDAPAVGVGRRRPTRTAVGSLEPLYGQFDPASHIFAGAGRHYTSSADYQSQVYEMIETDLDEALAEGGSPVKAAQEVLRILRDQLRSVIEFGGLSLESYIDFQSNVRGRINRLEAGPPPLRSQQLLALLDAGVVRIPLGPNPELAVDGGRFAWPSAPPSSTSRPRSRSTAWCAATSTFRRWPGRARPC